MSAVDPVSQASEYQQMLLALLGSDDPADVARQALTQWRALVTEAGADLGKRPADGEWSVIELLGHAADAELVVGGRLRWIASQDQPPLLGYDQDEWVSRLDHAHGDPAQLLDQFEALRRANLALWTWSTPEIRARVGIHQERGPESFDLSFRLLAGHDRFHLDQARRTLQQVRAG